MEHRQGDGPDLERCVLAMFTLWDIHFARGHMVVIKCHERRVHKSGKISKKLMTGSEGCILYRRKFTCVGRCAC